LNEITAGLHPSQFIVIAGRRGETGKSSFALKLMDEIAIKNKKPVVLFTLEVTSEQIIKNLLCATTGIDTKNAEWLFNGRRT